MVLGKGDDGSPTENHTCEVDWLKFKDFSFMQREREVTWPWLQQNLLLRRKYLTICSSVTGLFNMSRIDKKCAENKNVIILCKRLYDMVTHVTRSCLGDSGEFFLLIFRTTALIFQCLLVDSSKFNIDLLTSPRN